MENLPYFTFRLQCSRKEKAECLQTVRKLSRFLTAARSDGFLALAPFLEHETDALVKACLLDIQDGLDGVTLKQRFEGYLASGDYHGKDFLHAIVVLRGFLVLQGCQSPEVLWNTLQGFFGADFALEYREAFRLEQKAEESYSFSNATGKSI